MDHIDWLLKLAKEREEAEAAKPLEQREREYREKNEAEWSASEEGRLCREFYKAYTAYRDYLKRHRRHWREGNDKEVDFTEHQLFQQAVKRMEGYQQERGERDRRNLEKAQQAARCEHMFLNGDQCGSPKMKDHTLCYMHAKNEEAKAVKLDLGPMEDPDSIQVAIKKLQAAVIDQTLTDKQIAQLTNLLNIGAWNVIRTSGFRGMEK
jgi:hypothetical protein